MISNRTSANLPLLFGVLGAMLLGEGIMLFISSNWRAIPDIGKLALIFGNLAGTYALAYSLKYAARPRPGMASGLFLKGAIAYGGGIFLIAQIYNFHADWRTGLLYWFLGSLPLAYVADSRPVLALSLSTLVFWVMANFNFLSDEVVLLLPLLGAAFGLAGIIHWALPIGRFGGTYFMSGACLILINTLLLSWGGVARNTLLFEWTQKYRVFFVTLAGASVLLLVFAVILVVKSNDRSLSWLTVLLSTALALTIFLSAKPSLETIASNGFLLLINLLLFGECLGLIFAGAARGSTALVKLGVTFIGLHASFRFFDDGWSYLLRSAAFLLIGMGVMVLAFWLDGARRQNVKEA